MQSIEFDSLSEKVGGRYRLTVLIQKRLKELVKGAAKLVDVEDRNLINVVMEEIRQDKITFEDFSKDGDEAKKASRKKKKKD